MGFLRGIYHPKPTDDVNFKGDRFHEGEVDTASRLFVDKPVYVEHNPNIHAGKVVETRRGPQGTLECDIFIDESVPLGARVMEDVRNRTLRGLSIGFKALHDPSDNSYDQLQLREISIVEEGRLPDTHIYMFSDNGKLKIDADALASLPKNHNSKSLHEGGIPVEVKMSASQTEDFNKAQAAANGVAAAMQNSGSVSVDEAKFRELQKKLADLEAKEQVRQEQLRKEAEALAEKRAKHNAELLYNPETGLQAYHKAGYFGEGVPEGELFPVLEKGASTVEGAALLEVAYSNANKSRFYETKYGAEIQEKDKALQEKEKIIAEKEAMIQKLLSGPKETDVFMSRDDRTRPATDAAKPAATSSSSSAGSELDTYRRIMEQQRQQIARERIATVNVSHSAASAAPATTTASSAFSTKLSLSEIMRQAASTNPAILNAVNDHPPQYLQQ